MSHFDCAVLLPTVEGTVESAEALERAMAPYKEYLGDEGNRDCLEFVEDEGFDVDEETGRTGYWENPNARWDWFVVGGRWGGKLRLGDGGRSDVAAVADVVADVDPAAYAMALERYRRWLAGERVDDFELISYRRDIVLDRYPDAEAYARCRAGFWTHAVVTPDGEWHEVGRMGWFGISDESGEGLRDWVDHYRERYLDPYVDHTIVMVDCHI